MFSMPYCTEDKNTVFPVCRWLMKQKDKKYVDDIIRQTKLMN